MTKEQFGEFPAHEYNPYVGHSPDQLLAILTVKDERIAVITAIKERWQKIAEGRDTRISTLETELASTRNLYAAQEERYERGRKAEDTWSAAMASVYLATSGCSLPEFDTPMEVAERIKEHFAALSDEVDHLRADKERLDSGCIQLCGGKHYEIDLRAAIDAARKELG